MRVIAIFAALLAVASASPNLEARQQGEACKVVHGASCESQNAATERLSWCGRSLGAPPDERFQQVNTGLHGNEYL
ncbi:hypothetical protein N7524_011325 [Penicillium chrysogenum]|nr:hypothetical protein N7524_011325 [Penicillium chrysogenum]